MKKVFFIWGSLICVLFTIAGLNGMTTSDLFDSDKWGPKGRSAYHK